MQIRPTYNHRENNVDQTDKRNIRSFEFAYGK